MEDKIKDLENEILLLKAELEKKKGKHKKYYESNKEIVVEKANKRLKKLAEDNPEKIKEYAKRAYLKKKEKKKVEEDI
jgi:predicted AAA+ superfamily ATPase